MEKLTREQANKELEKMVKDLETHMKKVQDFADEYSLTFTLEPLDVLYPAVWYQGKGSRRLEIEEYTTDPDEIEAELSDYEDMDQLEGWVSSGSSC